MDPGRVARRAFEASYGALLGRRRWLLAAMVLVLGFCFWRAARMPVDEDITSFLPAGDSMVDEFRLVMERFRQQDQLFFDIADADGAPGNPADVSLAADILYDKLSASKLFSAIRYRITPEQGLAILDYIDASKPQLFAAEDVAALEKLMTPQVVAERLAAARRRLMEPEGLLLKDALRRDPIGLRAIFMEKLGGLQGGSDVHLEGGRIWSGDGRHALLIAEPGFPSTDTLKSERLFAVVHEACAAATAGVGSPVQIRYVGGHRGVMDNRTLMREDLARATILSLLGIGVVVYVAFRRRRLALLSFAPVAFGFMAAVGIFSFVTERAPLVIFGSASILIGLTIDYAIYVLYRYDNLPDAAGPQTIGRELSSLAGPLLLGAATTAAAFASLRVSALPGQRQLGLFSAIGVIVAVLFAMFILPHFLPRAAAKRNASIVPLARWCAQLIEWVARRRFFATCAVLALTALGALGLTRLRFDGDFRHLNGVRPETLRDEDAMLEHWGGALATTAVVVRGPTSAEALQANEKLAALLAKLQAEGSVRSYVSIASLVPSREQSETNRARWQAFWTEKRRAELSATVGTSAARLGFSESAFAPFWQELGAASRPADTPAALDLAAGPLEAVLQPFVAQRSNETLVLTRLEVMHHEELAAVSARIRAELPAVMVVNGRALAEHTADLVVASLGRLALVSAVAVTLLVLLFLRRPGQVAAVLVPVGLDVLWTLGALGLLNIPVNLMSCQFIGLLFGVVSDYAIFLADRLGQGHSEELGVTGGAVTLCAVTTMCGFGVLAVARHPVLFSMGAPTLLGVVLGVVSSVLVVPLIVRPAPEPVPRREVVA